MGYSSELTNRPSMPNSMTDIKQIITPNNIIVLHTGCDDCMTLERVKEGLFNLYAICVLKQSLKLKSTETKGKKRKPEVVVYLLKERIVRTNCVPVSDGLIYTESSKHSKAQGKMRSDM